MELFNKEGPVKVTVRKTHQLIETGGLPKGKVLKV